MLVTWQTEEGKEQLQVTASAKSLSALRFLHPPSDEVGSHGSTLKFQLLFFNTVATALKASTAKKTNYREHNDIQSHTNDIRLLYLLL